MSYTPPKQWSHGDQPDAAELNKYSDGLTYLNSMIGGSQLNPAVFYSQMEDGQLFYLVHKRRYLLYVSTGAIEDPAGVNASISLGNTQAINVYDLEQVAWLTPGKLYRVKGCSCCIEDASGV